MPCRSVFEGEGYQLKTAETFSSNPLILFIKPGSPLSPGKLTKHLPTASTSRGNVLYSACNFHGPGLQGQRASRAPFSAFVNLKGNIGLLLYKLREMQSGGPGRSQGALPATAMPEAPSPARGWERGTARPQAPSPPGGKKWGWGHPPSTPSKQLSSRGTALGIVRGYLGHVPSRCF